MSLSKTQIYRQIAQLHIDSLEQGFLGTLGLTFLTELYRAIDVAESSILIFDIENDVVTGFISGGAGMGPIYKAMFLRVWVWGVPLATRLVSIRRVKRIFDILKYSGNHDLPQTLPSHELYSIAVHPSVRGKGVAPKLYQNLCNSFMQRAVPSFRIIVGDKLTTAHGFYLKMGASLFAQTQIHPGEISHIYVHDINA